MSTTAGDDVVGGQQVLVTGGAGFIGSHIVDALLAAGQGVRVLDAYIEQAHGAAAPVVDLWDGSVEIVHADVRDRAAVEHALRDVDVVCHQAALVGLGVDLDDIDAYVAHNDLGTAVLLRAAAGRVGRVVLASSMVVYGEGRYTCPEHGAVRAAPRLEQDLSAGRFEPTCPTCSRPLEMATVDEDVPLDPRNVYAATKVAQEHLLASWARVSGGAGVALRYHNVYGPRMPKDTPYAGVASIFRSALARGEAPRVFEDGGQRRDFVHVRDVAAANVLALSGRGGAPGETRAYNVASGRPHTVGEMAAALADSYGGPAPVTTGDYRLGDVRHIVASPDRAGRELGFVAEVDFATGMTEFATAPLRS